MAFDTDELRKQTNWNNFLAIQVRNSSLVHSAVECIRTRIRLVTSKPTFVQINPHLHLPNDWGLRTERKARSQEVSKYDGGWRNINTATSKK